MRLPDPDPVEVTVDHYNAICSKCKVTNILYSIPLDLQTRCCFCRKRIFLKMPEHRLSKSGEEKHERK